MLPSDLELVGISIEKQLLGNSEETTCVFSQKINIELITTDVDYELNDKNCKDLQDFLRVRPLDWVGTPKIVIPEDVKELLSGIIGELEMYQYYEHNQETDADCEKLKDIFGLRDSE